MMINIKKKKSIPNNNSMRRKFEEGRPKQNIGRNVLLKRTKTKLIIKS